MSSLFDYDRYKRIGMPEAILCEDKEYEPLKDLLSELAIKVNQPVLLTRLNEETWLKLKSDIDLKADYDKASDTAILNGVLSKKKGNVSVVSGGTSDLKVALETCRTLSFLGYSSSLYSDVGVAGLDRVMDRLDLISNSDVVIVIAGMDAALASVLTGLIGNPIIGVPTSVGYGVCDSGRTALNAMLASCAQGLVVMNIDNGFGAASAAARIMNGVSQK
jgi:pyridinium-3,5-biscarboxylic acid mononucleotide synthase